MNQPEEYEKLGSYAFIGLPDEEYPQRFVEPDSLKAEYAVVIGGENFGCGSSREHAPVALGAAGTKVVVAQSFARIFFRNSVATGELYPVESETRLCDELKTGQEVIVDMEKNVLTVPETGRTYVLKELGAVSLGWAPCCRCCCVGYVTVKGSTGSSLRIPHYPFTPSTIISQAGPVIDAGGLFNFARKGTVGRMLGGNAAVVEF